MHSKGERALEPAHEKKSGAARDSKGEDDTDIGCHDYGAGGKRWQGKDLWDRPPKEVVGLSEERIASNNYHKDCPADPLAEGVLRGGPPVINSSKARRVF